MKKIITIGIDLAKNVFAVHAVDALGQVVWTKPAVKRHQLLELIGNIPPCVIGMEACTGAHHWAREFGKFGHTVRLVAPKFVIPYRLSGKRGKNDVNDAAAICETVTRPHMRFVPIKSIDAQAHLALHRVRQGFIEERTATINRIRAILAELGVVLPQKADIVRQRTVEFLEDLPGFANRVVGDLLNHLQLLDRRVAEYDHLLKQAAKEDERSQRMMQVPGIGPTTATALLASIGNGHEFKNGRQLAAWLGLVPGQYSSGGKPKLGRITKQGDRYIRTLLILGAKSVLATASEKTDRFSQWAQALRLRIGYGKTLVAIAAKNARILWAMLSKGENFNLAAWNK